MGVCTASLTAQTLHAQHTFYFCINDGVVDDFDVDMARIFLCWCWVGFWTPTIQPAPFDSSPSLTRKNDRFRRRLAPKSKVGISVKENTLMIRSGCELGDSYHSPSDGAVATFFLRCAFVRHAKWMVPWWTSLRLRLATGLPILWDKLRTCHGSN